MANPSWLECNSRLRFCSELCRHCFDSSLLNTLPPLSVLRTLTISFLKFFYLAFWDRFVSLALTVLKLGVYVRRLHIVSDPPASTFQVMALQKYAAGPDSWVCNAWNMALYNMVCAPYYMRSSRKIADCILNPPVNKAGRAGPEGKLLSHPWEWGVKQWTAAKSSPRVLTASITQNWTHPPCGWKPLPFCFEVWPPKAIVSIFKGIFRKQTWCLWYSLLPVDCLNCVFSVLKGTSCHSKWWGEIASFCLGIPNINFFFIIHLLRVKFYHKNIFQRIIF